MGVLCARTLKSIYIIADRLSPSIDWSGFSILFFSLFPSNRHPLVLSYVSLIRPITAAYIIADWWDTMPVHLETHLHHEEEKGSNLQHQTGSKSLTTEPQEKLHYQKICSHAEMLNRCFFFIYLNLSSNKIKI